MYVCMYIHTAYVCLYIMCMSLPFSNAATEAAPRGDEHGAAADAGRVRPRGVAPQRQAQADVFAGGQRQRANGECFIHTTVCLPARF